jgi:hypothetical protein
MRMLTRQIMSAAVVAASLVAGAPAAHAADPTAPCLEPPGALPEGSTSAIAIAATSPTDAVAIGIAEGDTENTPAVWITRDRGVRWDRLCADTPAFRLRQRDPELNMLDVAAGASGTVVAVGTTDVSGGGRPVTWRSGDGGASWTRIDLPKDLWDAGENAFSPAVEAVAWTGEEFVAAGVDGDPKRLAVWTSPNGKKWLRVRGAAAKGLEAPRFNQVVDIAVDDSGSVVIAGELNSPSHPDSPRNPRFFLRRAGTQRWVAASPPSGAEREVGLVGVTAVGNEFVAVGLDLTTDNTGVEITSGDGLTWHAAPQWEPGDRLFNPDVIAGSATTGTVVVGKRCTEDSDVFDCTTEMWRRGADGVWTRVTDGVVVADDVVSAVGVGIGPPATYFVGDLENAGDGSVAGFKTGSLPG